MDFTITYPHIHTAGKDKRNLIITINDGHICLSRQNDETYLHKCIWN